MSEVKELNYELLKVIVKDKIDNMVFSLIDEIDTNEVKDEIMDRVYGHTTLVDDEHFEITHCTNKNMLDDVQKSKELFINVLTDYYMSKIKMK